ncbi:MAG: hypothetical protein HKN30_16640, partial [Sulfitobacter sp.]|nr:hypothetical protein [Sulfitobacter sp.]
MGGTVEISVFWLGLAGLVVASVLVAQLPLSRFTGKEVPLIALQRRLRLDGLNSGFFFLLCLVGIALALLWLVILWLLLAGLVGQIQLVIETG